LSASATTNERRRADLGVDDLSSPSLLPLLPSFLPSFLGGSLGEPRPDPLQLGRCLGMFATARQSFFHQHSPDLGVRAIRRKILQSSLPSSVTAFLGVPIAHVLVEERTAEWRILVDGTAAIGLKPVAVSVGLLGRDQGRYLQFLASFGVDNNEPSAGPEMLLGPGHHVCVLRAEPLEVGWDQETRHDAAPERTEFAGTGRPLKAKFGADGQTDPIHVMGLSCKRAIDDLRIGTHRRDQNGFEAKPLSDPVFNSD
jgi:hypothetical protein